MLPELEPWRRRIDAELSRQLDALAGAPPQLLEAMRYSLLAPGKRLRPLLVLLASEAVGGAVEPALPAAAAVEMVHAYSLVHDDLPGMDDDDLRRGRPTCHKQFDEATAILVGDGLLTLAFQVLAEQLQPPAVAAVCCAELARGAGAAGMVGGQMDDLLAEKQASGDLALLESIHRRKTGALFRAAVRIGALIGLKPASPMGATLELPALTAYADHLGLAFQIADDLLDAEGDEAEAGKRVGKDAGRGKLTYPGLLGAQESRRRLETQTAAAVAALAPLGEGAAKLRGLVQSISARSR